MITSTATNHSPCVLRSADDVLAKVPFLVGFHPRESLVALGLGSDRLVRFTLRADLPGTAVPAERRSSHLGRAAPGRTGPTRGDSAGGDSAGGDSAGGDSAGGDSAGGDSVGGDSVGVDPAGAGGLEPTLARAGRGSTDDADALVGLAASFVTVFRNHDARWAVLLAYTEHRDHAREALRALRRALVEAGVGVLDGIVADGRRWWSELCTDDGCCRPGGRPYDLSAHPVTAQSVYAGEVALADEAAVHAMLGPREGASRPATEALYARVAEECAAQFAVESSPREARVAAAERVVGDLLERCRRAELPLPAQLAARAAVLAGDIAVRDAICASMRRRDASTHVQLWTDVLRGAPPPHDVAPATVLGFAAWLAGNGVLARCALSRAVGGAPADRLVRLLSDLLQHAVSSDLWPGVDGDRVG